MKVRIAQRGIGRNSTIPATVDDVVAGAKLPWVELDGHRLTDIAGIRFVANPDLFGAITMEVDILGPVEVVYVDRAGDPIPHGVTPPDSPHAVIPEDHLGGLAFDASTVLDR